MDWNDITIDKFQKIYEAEKRGGDDMLFEVLAIVRGVSLDEILNTPLSKLEGMWKDIEFFKSKPRIPLVKGKYDLGGTKYRIWMKPGDMTVAQYIDFTAFSPEYSSHLARFLSTVVIPEGHKYGDGYDVDKAASDIGNYMKVTDGLAVASFFLTYSAVLGRLILRSSLRKLKRQSRRETDPEIKAKLEEIIIRGRRLLS